jgi:DNA repair protein RecN (Recombination protein N)
MLEGAGSLRSVLEHALESLDVSDESNPRDVLAETRLALEGFESFEELRGALSTAESLLDDLGSELRKASELVEENPERLTLANERLSLLHHLCRRYGPTLDDVSLKRKEFSSQLATLVNAEEARLSLDERTRAATLVLEKVSSEVLAQRQRAAPVMVQDLLIRLASLALEHASLEITLEGESGDRVDLLFSANPGLALAPVSAVASGGELARLMLAIRLALPGEAPTMIFDEVDAGIGGSTAVSLASALKDVSSHAQVLVVTHLAQVAAVASCQVSVSKETGDSATLATARVITGDDRVREIARMLSGQPENETALEHARELLHDRASAT